MTVLLTILKVLGIILLVIFALILFIILSLIFVPVRYHIKACRTGVDEDPPVQAKAWISWFLHFLHVSILYPQNEKKKLVCVRILGIPVFKYDINQTAKKDENNKKKQDEKTQASSESTEDTTVNPESVEETMVSSENLAETSDKTEMIEAASVKAESLTESSDKAETLEDTPIEREYEEDISVEAETEHKSIFSKIADLYNHIKCTIKKIYDKINNLIHDTQNRSKRISNNIHYYHNLLTSELFERTLEKVKKKLLRFLKEIMPTKFQVFLEVGFDDPYTTGEVMAIAGIMYPVIGNNIHIQANFEESVIRGAADIKGRLYLLSALKLGLYYLTDRDLKRLIKLFKKEDIKRGRK